MAVVIGIEPDTLFGCTPGAEGCTGTYLKEQIAHYKEKGVRYIFPVHFYDNAFTGGAYYNDLFYLTDFFDTELFPTPCCGCNSGVCNDTGAGVQPCLSGAEGNGVLG